MMRYGAMFRSQIDIRQGAIESEGRPMNDLATAGSATASTMPADRRRTLAARVGRGLMTLLPGLALLAFWQWASGRLIKEIYVSKPTAVQRGSMSCSRPARSIRICRRPARSWCWAM